MTGLVAGDLGRALVPDDDRARAVCLPRPDPFKVARGQGVVLNRYGKPPDTGIQRRPLRNCPRAEDIANLDPEVEMKRRRIVELNHKARRRHAMTILPSPYSSGTCPSSPDTGVWR